MTYIAVASYVMTASYNSHHSSLVAAHVDYIMPNDYCQCIVSPDSLTLPCVLGASQTASLGYNAMMSK